MRKNTPYFSPGVVVSRRRSCKSLETATPNTTFAGKISRQPPSRSSHKFILSAGAASCLQYLHAWLLHCHRVEFSTLCETPERLRGLEKKTSQEPIADVMWWIPSEQQPQQQQAIIIKKKSSARSHREAGFGRKVRRPAEQEA